jgi:hypothetical protein
MTVRIADEAGVEGLARFLERAGCRVQRRGAADVDVLFDVAVRDDAARLELDLYLRTWEATSGGFAAQID